MATMERIVLALGARGLVNAQFIVRDDGVYLIEVNPRASRTVPFMSKVTGVPMVELAVRIALGRDARRSSAGTAGCCRRRRSSRSRRRPSRRPSCAASTRRSARACSRPARSSASTRTRGWRWPRRSSARRWCRRGPATAGALALLSIADRDKGTLPRLAAALAARRLSAGGDARARGRALADAGYDARPVAKLGEAPDDVDRRGRRSSTSSRPARSASSSTRRRRAPGAVRDAAEIRLAATAEGILCLTAMETAVAAAEALDPAIADAPGRGALARRVGARRRVSRGWSRTGLTTVAASGAGRCGRGVRPAASPRSPARATTGSASSARP